MIAVGHVGVGQPLGDLLARPVDVDVVLEGQDHLRQTERRDRPLDQHARRAGQRPLQRDRHPLLDLLRGLAGEEGDDHDLDVGDVGERLDLQVAERQHAEDREREGADQRGRAPADGEVDQTPGSSRRPVSTRPGGACHAAGIRKVRARRRRGFAAPPRGSAGAKCPAGLIAPSILPDARHSSRGCRSARACGTASCGRGRALARRGSGGRSPPPARAGCSAARPPPAAAAPRDRRGPAPSAVRW